MKTIDVTVLGELNIDLLLNRLDQFPENGKEILAHQMNLSMGSSSAIFAANLSALGTGVQFMGKLGTDLFGHFILGTLESRKVLTHTIIQEPRLSTGATVVLNLGQDRAMVTHPGAMADFSYSDINWLEVYKSRHLHISSIFLQPSLKENIVTIFKKAKEAGLTTSMDPQSDPADKWDLNLAHLLPYVDVFLPNESELCKITGEPTLEKALNSIEPVQKRILIVKMGEKGSLCIEGSNQRFLPASKVAGFVDAIGAGDSYNAGFIHQWLQGSSLEQCQEFGSACGAHSTTAAGGINAFNQIQALYANHTTTA